MSSEQPPNNGNYEFESNQFYCNDIGMERLIDEMADTEYALARNNGEDTSARLIYQLNESFRDQGYESEDGCAARITGKLRPEIRYDSDGNVDKEYLLYLRSKGGFSKNDEYGYYRQLENECITFFDPRIYSSHDAVKNIDHDYQVGLYCEYETASGYVQGYVNSQEIDHFLSTRLSTDEARQIIKSNDFQVEEFCDGLYRAANGLGHWLWLKSMRLVIPDMPGFEKRTLQSALEIYMKNKADFDKEPYQLELKGDIKMRPYAGAPLVSGNFDEAQKLIVTVDDIEMLEIEDEKGVCWQPCITVCPLVRGDDEKTVIVPLDSLQSFTPLLEYENQVVDRLMDNHYKKQDEAETERLYQQKQQEQQQRNDMIVRKRLALQAVHQFFEGSQFSDTPQGERLEDLLARSDSLLEVYDIPSLARQSETEQRRVAGIFIEQQQDRVGIENLSIQKQAEANRSIHALYHELLATDQAMLREILLAMLQKRHTQTMSADQLQEVREELYSKFLVDYEQSISSKWLDLVDAVLPGDEITRQHEAVVNRAQEQKEIKRQQSVKEAHLRNDIGRQLLDGQPADESDPAFGLYRSVCVDLQEYPYLQQKEKEQLLWRVCYVTQLPLEVVQVLGDIVTRSTSGDNE